MDKTPAKTLTSISQLLDNTVNAFKANWKKLSIISLLFLAAPQMILTIAASLVEKFTGSSGASYEIDVLAAGGTVIALMLILYIAIFILSLIGGITLAVLANNPKLSIEESLKQGLGKFFSYLWISALAGLIVLAGFIFFIIPGVLFSVWFSLILYALVIEDKKGAAALSRSKELVGGCWWKIFGRYIILGLILIGISLVLAWIPILGSLVLTTLITPISTLYLFFIYQDLKKIKS